jgi:hypothetical protein
MRQVMLQRLNASDRERAGVGKRALEAARAA